MANSLTHVETLDAQSMGESLGAIVPVDPTDLVADYSGQSVELFLLVSAVMLFAKIHGIADQTVKPPGSSFKVSMVRAILEAMVPPQAPGFFIDAIKEYEETIKAYEKTPA